MCPIILVKYVYHTSMCRIVVACTAGTLLVQHGRPEDGEVYLRKALELNPHHTGAANNLKVALYDKKMKVQQRKKQPTKNGTKQTKTKKKKKKRK